MKKLIQIDLIEKVGVDKCLHFLVGFAFVLAGFMYCLGFSNSPAGWGGWACFIIVENQGSYMLTQEDIYASEVVYGESQPHEMNRNVYGLSIERVPWCRYFSRYLCIVK